MILTCPECATSYFVEDGRVPAQGRRVRCSTCDHRWLAGPEGPIAEAPEVAPEVIVEPEVEAIAPEEPAHEAVVPEPPLRVRPAAARGRKAGKGSSAMVWAGAAALAAALIAGVIVFRGDVIRLWPASSAAYAGLGFAVDGGGLVLEGVHVEPTFLAGRPVLSVTGAIRNVRDQPVASPPVRVTLLNRAGKPVAAKIGRPMDPNIPAHAQRYFAVAIPDPPDSARDLEVRFEAADDAKGASAATEAVVTPAPPAIAPQEAAPLTPAEASERG